MSALKEVRRIMPPHIRDHKGAAEPLVCLTAYSAPMARMIDPFCDMILVGDSLGMVLYGMSSTLPVTLNTMIAHTKAVTGNARHACVVIDMPFGSYQESRETAFRNCARAIAQTGCSAVKLEGGEEMADTIGYITERGIPVLAHIGLMPQHFNSMGGYRVQGKSAPTTEKTLKDAQAVAEAGAFAVVLEGVVESVSRKITAEISIPTIGIGASNACDGQILVTDDMLGMTGGPYARFVRNYADISKEIEKAVSSYADDVKSRNFPGEKHTYGDDKN